MFFGLSASALFSQNEIDALRYSQTNLTGTARSIGAGNAFGAVGGDFNSTSINPAGLGVYRRNELGASLGFYNNTTRSFFINNTGTDSKFNLNLSNLGFVISTPTENSSGWKFVNFGIGVNRNNNFNQRIYFSGTNTKSSMLDYFLEKATGQRYDQMSAVSLERLAWATYLIDTLPGYMDQYYNDLVNDTSFSINQSNSLASTGNMRDINISLGGNYEEKFYLGASVLLSRIKYTENVTYNESDNTNSVANFNSFTLDKYLNTEGTGIAARIGAIIRPVDEFRIGFSYQSPTAYKLNDNYNYSLTSSINQWVDTATSPDGEYDYNLTTPGKITASAAYFFGKQGFISADFETSDYSRARLSSDGYAFVDENIAIREQYRRAYNFRLGGELLVDVYSFRAGFMLNGTPFSNKFNVPDVETMQPGFSLGMGIRGENNFIDFAYQNVFATTYYSPYTLTAINKPYYTAKNNSSISNFVVSLGFKF